MTLGIAALVGASTPGFARGFDRVVNVPTSIAVPEIAPLSETPAVAPVVPDPAVAPAAPVAPSEADDDGDYATLDAAVAAQDTPDALDDETTCMAGAVYFEAKGEPLSGQLAVAEVILNRTKSGRFPKSICSVVTQPGQFSFVRAGHVPTIAGNHAYRTAVAVARVAMADAWDSPAPEAMYFHARQVSPGWRRTKIAAIGNHVFYR